jgi:hypothetical protein
MLRSAALVLLSAAASRADVIVHYQTTITTAAILPPEAQEQLKKSGGVSITMLVKGSKGYTKAGDFVTVTDLTSQTTTLMNTAAKTFASLPLNQYDQMQAVSQLIPKPSAETQTTLANMETKVESRKTGRTEKIHGIVAEERQIVMSMNSKAATDQEKAGQLMRMVIELWSPAPSEGARVPALGEVERFSALSKTAMDPGAMIEQMLGPYSGVAKGYDTLAKELAQNGSLLLRMRTSIYVPALAETATALAQSGKQVPAFDPSGPLSQITQEVTDLSTAPVSDSAFAVPQSYKQSTVAEILKSRFPQLAGK